MENINKHDVGRRIKSIRLKKGFNMREFGERLDNASDSIVSRWEKGKTLPNSNRLKKIAEIGEVSIDELLYGKEYTFLEVGKILYEKSLKLNNDKTNISKALNFFKNSYLLDDILIKSAKNLIEIPTLNEYIKTPNDILDNINDTRLMVYFNNTIFIYYLNNIKNDNNLIDSRILHIKKLKPYDYQEYPEKFEFHSKNNDSQIIASLFEKNISPNIQNKVMNILDEAIEKLKELKDEAIDTHSQKAIDYTFIEIIENDIKTYELGESLINDQKINSKENMIKHVYQKFKDLKVEDLKDNNLIEKINSFEPDNISVRLSNVNEIDEKIVVNYKDL
ncbi:helix-turn-helix domain-containing protein [Macrococcoides goetzii]|uniref:helix-turn-helix domain-containing protein n=1 Tax=Macrococcoides goetzii TaxID=1891097 RepID=UPI000C6893B4|nr:helix-turn-helix transcriptional regulator [Macrococcus goetzii]